MSVTHFVWVDAFNIRFVCTAVIVGSTIQRTQRPGQHAVLNGSECSVQNIGKSMGSALHKSPIPLNKACRTVVTVDSDFTYTEKLNKTSFHCVTRSFFPTRRPTQSHGSPRSCFLNVAAAVDVHWTSAKVSHITNEECHNFRSAEMQSLELSQSHGQMFNARETGSH